MKTRLARRRDIFRRATRSLNGIIKISRRNSGGNSRPLRRRASTFGCSHCSIGPKLTSGATSNAKTSRFQKCISRGAENGFVRSGAAPSHTRSRAQPRQSTKLSPSWRRRGQRSALGARKIIMSAMRCRSCEQKDFYENREAETGYRKESVMTRAEFRKRTFEFGIRCIRLAESLPKTTVSQIIAKQLIRAATSVGANYRAAIRSRSRADFIAKMGIVEEECDESLYWLKMLVDLRLISGSQSKNLGDEANEILSIVVASIKTARRHIRQLARYS